MQVEGLAIDEEDEKDSLLEIITSLSWEAATLLKSDTSKGRGMDPGRYVKVKYIASGRRGVSAVVKGVACKKNVAHGRMTSTHNLNQRGWIKGRFGMKLEWICGALSDSLMSDKVKNFIYGGVKLLNPIFLL